jgi:hypothetical protein
MKDFYICHNPLYTFTGGITAYVFHAGKPRFFAALFTIDPKDFHPLNYDGRNLPFLYRRGDGHLQLFLILVTQDIDRAGGKLDAALKQAASWHASALNAEDEKNYGKRSAMNLLPDYNALTPAMKVIQLPAVNKYILCEPKGVSSFDTPEAMDQFMTDTLGYNDLQLESGNQNVYDPH